MEAADIDAARALQAFREQNMKQGLLGSRTIAGAAKDVPGGQTTNRDEGRVGPDPPVALLGQGGRLCGADVGYGSDHNRDPGMGILGRPDFPEPQPG